MDNLWDRSGPPDILDADYYVQDIEPPDYPYSLSDFFNFSLPPSTFKSIAAPLNANFFITYNGEPQDPDDDADESQ